jgi:hypothetical protein
VTSNNNSEQRETQNRGRVFVDSSEESLLLAKAVSKYLLQSQKTRSGPFSKTENGNSSSEVGKEL